MKWTFGISLGSPNYLKQLLNSIVTQNSMSSSDYEIIVVGSKTDEVVSILTPVAVSGIRLLMVDFDETIKSAWITKKKNIITSIASFDNVCYMHDYVSFCPNWYDGFIKYGSDWDVCMNPIRRIDGRRFRDWVSPQVWWGNPKFVSYHDYSLTSRMYVSGTYWCAKKKFMMENPLDENRCWGHGEDIEWSSRCRSKWNYKLNTFSVVKLLKEKIFNGMIDYSPHPDTDPDKEFVF